MGRAHLGSRLRRQAIHATLRYRKGRFRLHWEHMARLYASLELFLKAAGLYAAGCKNTLNYAVTHQTPSFWKLPAAFKGFRILHLSDIHVEGIIDGGLRLKHEIGNCEFDLCVITGDFRYLAHSDYQASIQGMQNLMDVLACPFGVVGILGNHDFIEMVPLLESVGIKILLNEAMPIHRKGSTIWISGVDDPYLYELADLEKALKPVPQNAFKILLAHSPDLIRKASARGVDYYLCGHTHGGQICLPGGIALFTHTTCPKKFVSGAWQFNHTKGYTSRGTGSSGVSVRFFCPPEIILHQLT